MNKNLLGLAGEYRVCYEILKRGLHASITYGNSKSTDIIVLNSEKKAAVVEVKSSLTKNSFVTGFYQKYRAPGGYHPDFWVLFSIKKEGSGYQERFFVLSHAEVSAAQAERNLAVIRKNGNTEDPISWERMAELCNGGVDNIYLKDILAHEDAWDKLLAFMATP